MTSGGVTDRAGWSSARGSYRDGRCPPARRSPSRSTSTGGRREHRGRSTARRDALAEQAPAYSGRRLPSLETRPDEHVVEPAPRERDADEPDLDDQRPPVRGGPQVVELRQPLDRDDRAGHEEQRDQEHRDPREAQECGPPQVGASGQTTTASVRRPPTQSIAVTRCTQSATSPRAVEFGSVAWCPESG